MLIHVSMYSLTHFTQDTVILIDKCNQCVCLQMHRQPALLLQPLISVFFRMQARLWSIKTISLFSQLQCSVYMYALLLPECQHCLRNSCTSSLCGPNVHHCHRGWVINPVSDDNIYSFLSASSLTKSYYSIIARWYFQW